MSIFGSFINEQSERETIELTDYEVKGIMEAREIAEIKAIDEAISMEDIIITLAECACVEDAEVTLDEGANIDMTKVMVEFRKNFKAKMKEFKSKMKAKEFDDAKKIAKELSSMVDGLEKDIRSIDADNTGSAILGYFATALVNSLQLFLPMSISSFGFDISVNAIFAGKETLAKVASGVSIAGSVLTWIKSIVMIVNDLKTFIDECNNKDTATAEALNLYRNKLLTFTKKFKKNIDKLPEMIDKAEMKAKEKEAK